MSEGLFTSFTKEQIITVEKKIFYSIDSTLACICQKQKKNIVVKEKNSIAVVYIGKYKRFHSDMGQNQEKSKAAIFFLDINFDF